MSITHWLKVASILFVIGASVSGVGLLVQNAASSTQPPPEGDHKAARTDKLARPGGQTRQVLCDRGRTGVPGIFAKSGHVLPGRGRYNHHRILPEGSRVKKGDIVCELDSAALRDRLTDRHHHNQKSRVGLRGAQARPRGRRNCRD